jgi:hypothetical protein
MKSNLKLFYLLLSVLMVAGLASCKKSEEGGSGAPTVTRVRLLSKTDTTRDVIHNITLDSISVYDQSRVRAFDSTVTAGRLGTQYAILGTNLLTTKTVVLNGVSIYFNPGLITDNSIILTIPITVPYGTAQPNKLVITTQHGSVSFDFSIRQPLPVITSFTPTAGIAGDLVTITGTALDNATGVKFDDIPAQIQGTPTKTTIQVKVPAGVINSFIYVTTPGGTAKSIDSYGIPAPVFKALIYDDNFAANWTGGGYSTDRDLANKEHTKRGQLAIKTTATGAYGGLVLTYKDANGNGLDVSKLGATSIKYSLYGDAASDGKKVQVYVNGNFNTSIQATIVGGKYVDITVPLSSFAGVTVITEIAIQEAGGAPPLTWWVDDLGIM